MATFEKAGLNSSRRPAWARAAAAEARGGLVPGREYIEDRRNDEPDKRYDGGAVQPESLQQREVAQREAAQHHGSDHRTDREAAVPAQ